MNECLSWGSKPVIEHLKGEGFYWVFGNPYYPKGIVGPDGSPIEGTMMLAHACYDYGNNKVVLLVWMGGINLPSTWHDFDSFDPSAKWMPITPPEPPIEPRIRTWQHLLGTLAQPGTNTGDGGKDVEG